MIFRCIHSDRNVAPTHQTFRKTTAQNKIDAVIIIFLISLFGCTTSPKHNRTQNNDDELWLEDDRTSLSATILSYNVAGLPDLFSSSHPSVNHAIISEKLNDFDVVLVQEDFWYHKELTSRVTLAFASPPARKGFFGLGDGLNRFAVYTFENYSRIRWIKSYGIFNHSSDSLAAKGFTAATHHLSRYISVDIYNLHMDAGSNHKDFLAREAQINQLAKVINEKSTGNAVIVAGDWNLKENRSDDCSLLEQFKESLSLEDAREVLSVGQDRIDRILYRSGTEVQIVPLFYKVETAIFRDADRMPLSDHEAISVKFLFTRTHDLH